MSVNDCFCFPSAIAIFAQGEAFSQSCLAFGLPKEFWYDDGVECESANGGMGGTTGNGLLTVEFRLTGLNTIWEFDGDIDDMAEDKLDLFFPLFWISDGILPKSWMF